MRAGILLSMRSGDTRIKLTTSFAWYNSSDGLDSSETRGQASGAYIFRHAAPLRLENSFSTLPSLLASTPTHLLCGVSPRPQLLACTPGTQPPTP